MAIMKHSLPNFKSFLHNVRMPDSVRLMLARMMISILVRTGRNSSMHAASVLDGKRRHRAQPGRFLRRQGWRMLSLLGRLTRKLLLGESWSGRYLFLIDSTLVGHQSQTMENTYSTGNRRRRPQKNRRYKKYKYAGKGCHCFVFGLLLTPEGLRIPYYKPLYTKAYAQKKDILFRTQAQLAAQLVDDLPVPYGVSLTVLGDTAFDAAVVRKACRSRGFQWIFPCNTNRVFAGQRGQRPRVTSRIEQLSHASFRPIRLSVVAGAYAAQRRLSCHRAKAKRKTRTYYVHSEEREVHSVGCVRLVFSSTQKITEKAKRDVTKVLMTNAVGLSSREIVELYNVRWQIELFFKELKSVLGMHQYRYQQFAAVEGWIDIVLMTFVYLEWTRAKKLADRRIKKDTKSRWRHQRAYGIRQAVLLGIEVRQRTWIAQRLKTPHGRKTLAKTLTQLNPKEYQCFV